MCSEPFSLNSVPEKLNTPSLEKREHENGKFEHEPQNNLIVSGLEP